MTHAAASGAAIDEPVIRANRNCEEADARPISAPAPNAAPTTNQREVAIPASYRKTSAAPSPSLRARV